MSNHFIQSCPIDQSTRTNTNCLLQNPSCSIETISHIDSVVNQISIDSCNIEKKFSEYNQLIKLFQIAYNNNHDNIDQIKNNISILKNDLHEYISKIDMNARYASSCLSSMILYPNAIVV